MEDGKQAALQHGLEVDHDIAATDEVELAKRRVRPHVVRSEDDHLANVFDDVIGSLALHEVPRQALGRHILDDALPEDALPAFSMALTSISVAKIFTSRLICNSSITSRNRIATE